MSFLNVINLYKSFDRSEVLRDVSLSLEKGEVLSVIGSSGSGKTTLLRCLNFLESADSGQFLLNGETMFNGPIKALSDNELREKRLHVGLVFQSFNLFPHYTILKNVSLAPQLLIRESIKNRNKESANQKIYTGILSYYFGDGEIKESKIKEVTEKKAMELLKEVGLEQRASAYPHQLSGGQQQRVAIARALALNPSLLCFDEPTSALDPELTGEVLKVIKSLKDNNRTMIIVTHEMGFAKNVSDKVLFMSDGRVEELGEPEQIFNEPKSQKLKQFLNSVYQSKEADYV